MAGHFRFSTLDTNANISALTTLTVSMLATNAPTSVPAPALPAPTQAPTNLPLITKNEEPTLALAAKRPPHTMTYMRQLALLVVYYLMFKAVTTNPITINLRQHLRAKLAPGAHSVTDPLRAFLRRFV